MKTILLPLLGTGGNSAPLALAARVAALFDAHIAGLHIRRDTVEEISTITMGEGAVTQDMWDIVEGENAKCASAAKSTFESFCGRNALPVIPPSDCSRAMSASWRSYEGDLRAGIIAEARVRDLVVTGRDEQPFGLPAAMLADIVMQSGRPVLLVPRKIPAATGNVVAIAWKNTAESARALTAAMPFLRKAKRVVVLAVAEGAAAPAQAESAGALAGQLRWHLKEAPEVCAVTAGRHRVSTALVGAAVSAGADLLISGAYGHSRAREFILGGVTQELLEGCELPVLLTH